jgi:hypothetical protein
MRFDKDPYAPLLVVRRLSPDADVEFEKGHRRYPDRDVCLPELLKFGPCIRILLQKCDEDDFGRAKTLNGFGSRVHEEVRPNLVAIRDRENAHVDQLTAAVESPGGDPVEEACYDFGVDDVDDFLAVAALLEKRASRRTTARSARSSVPTC